MNAQLRYGLIIITISLLMTRFIEKPWQKAAILFLGLIALVFIVLFPYSKFFVSSLRTPTDAEILRLLYGENAVIQENQNGGIPYLVEELSTVEKEQLSYAAQVNTQIVGKLIGWDQDPHKVLVLTRTGPPTCCDRSQVPVLGGALLYWKDGIWQVYSYQKLITPYAGFDGFEVGEIKAIGPRKTCVVLQERLVRNGLSYTWDILISDVDGLLHVITRIETNADNAARCPPISEDQPCWAYTTTYEFVPGRDPADNETGDIYDIVLRNTGTKLVDGEHISLEEIARLVFFNGEYQFVGE